MKIGEYEELFLTLNQIRRSRREAEFVANQFVTISKPTPENLAIYNYTVGRFDSTRQFFFLISRSLLTCLTLITVPLYLRKREGISPRGKRSIFISHFFSNYQEHSGGADPFFGQLPELSRLSGLEPEIMYIDQESSNFGARVVSTVSGSPYKVIGIQKLDFDYISLLFRNFILAIRLFKDGLKLHNRVLRSVLLRVAASQVSRATFRNQILAREIVREIDSSDVEEIWITVEGHAYERAIISSISNKSSGVRINLYQHAAITPAQMGIFDLLADFGSSVHFFLSGKITFDYFKKHFPSLAGNMKIAGSSKAVDVISIENLPASQNRKSLLFLPEGTAESAFSMVQLAIDFSRLDRSRELVIRFHPNTPRVAIKKVHILLNQSDIEISTIALADDFKRSFACVYRSSATVIEALPFDILPVHFASENEFDLDCLALADLTYPRITTARLLFELLGGDQFHSSSKLFSPSEDFVKYSRDYFTPWVNGSL
jgi:hypothetical protein